MNETSSVHDTLYYNNKTYMPKIHSIRENHLEEESENSFTNGWSQSVSSITKVQSEDPVQECRPPLVRQYFNTKLKTWLPISLSSSMLQTAEADSPEVGAVGQSDDDSVDFRPHFFDPVLKEYVLCDSGSMVSAWPPDPGDQKTPGHYLKAANGSRMACFGYKKVNLKTISHLQHSNQFKSTSFPNIIMHQNLKRTTYDTNIKKDFF